MLFHDRKKLMILSASLVAVLLLGSLAAGILTLLPKISRRSAVEPVSAEEMLSVPSPSAAPADLSKVPVRTELETYIQAQYGDKANEKLNDYRTVILRCDVPQTYQSLLDGYILGGCGLERALVSYSLLCGAGGSTEDLKQCLENGDSSDSLLLPCIEKTIALKPRDVTAAEMNDLEEAGLSADDVMIADQLAQAGFASYEELLERRRSGTGWKQIKQDLGLLNQEERLPSITADTGKVAAFARQYGLSEESVYFAYSLSAKSGASIEEALGAVAAAGADRAQATLRVYKQLYE